MLTDLLKESFDLFVRENWLKTINKEIDRYNKYNQKAKMSAHAVHELIRRYNELYPNDKIEAIERKD